MKLKSTLVLTFILMLKVIPSIAQKYTQGGLEDNYRANWMFGVYGGATYSSTSNLETTILSEPFFLNYTLDKKARTGWCGGLFANYRGDGKLGVQGEIIYSQQGSDLKFNNTQTDFNYKLQFKYQYINLNAILKIYPFDYNSINIEGLNVGLGLQVGFNTTPHNIIYTSGGLGRLAAFGNDLEQQQQIRNVLKGKTNFAAIFGLGYELEHFTFEARYNLGLIDVVETKPNSYNFIENDNKNTFFQFSVGYHCPLN